MIVSADFADKMINLSLKKQILESFIFKICSTSSKAHCENLAAAYVIWVIVNFVYVLRPSNASETLLALTLLL